jgi:Holliday junction resolvase RusA-like endonuclease
MGEFLVLEDSKGSANDLIEIKTGGNKNRKWTKKELTINIKSWMENKYFDKFREKKLDLSIVAYVNDYRMKNQDVDNIAKPILDALQKDKNDPKKPYLFKDDSQVVRLIVYKKPKEDLVVKDHAKEWIYKTDSVMLSFREHDPKKQMILVDRTSRYQKEEDF